MSRIVSNVLLWLLERAEVATGEPCAAYGGISADKTRVRLCEKRRWHSDSHAYEWRDCGAIAREWRPL